MVKRTIALQVLSGVGAAAFAWNASSALAEPVAAIVPGYGLADVVPQALGGWFGFGLHDWLQSATQSFLAAAAPSLAQMGRRLARSAPHQKRAASGAPVAERRYTSDGWVAPAGSPLSSWAFHTVDSAVADAEPVLRSKLGWNPNAATARAAIARPAAMENLAGCRPMAAPMAAKRAPLSVFCDIHMISKTRPPQTRWLSAAGSSWSFS